jgi:alkylated DNA repair dioxygenase AlkB
MVSTENLLPFDGEAFYLPEFFSKNESAQLFIELKNEIEWKHEPIFIFGKKVMQPRLTALYGDPLIPYGYSGIEMNAKPFNKTLLHIKNKIESFANHEFTHVLLNYYRNGQDSMGWHRDNERSLGKMPVIGSVSFGVSRDFQLRNYVNKKLKTNLTLESGSLLIMKGKSQECWEHQIPKSKKVLEERINLTFRKIII